MKLERGVAAKLMKLLSENGVPVLLISTSETEISLLVPQALGARTVALIKERFDV